MTLYYVPTGSHHPEAIVNLSGGACGGMTYYIAAIAENNQRVADDVFCNTDQAAYGIYNTNPTATGGQSCSFN